MSLACFECGQGGEFNTLVVHLLGKESLNRRISSLPNFYTCCASVNTFKESPNGEFAIVREKNLQSSWCTGDDGPKLSECAVRRISATDLKAKLPRTHDALVLRAKRKE